MRANIIRTVGETGCGSSADLVMLARMHKARMQHVSVCIAEHSLHVGAQMRTGLRLPVSAWLWAYGCTPHLEDGEERSVEQQIWLAVTKTQGSIFFLEVHPAQG